MNKCLLPFYGALLLMAPLLQAADDGAAQQQLEALQQRVTELEKRLDTLAIPQGQQATRAASAPQSSGHSEVISDWKLLKVGYSYEEVRELLGTPVKITPGLMEFWFYSERDLDGPFVKFLFNQVNSWKAPQAK